MISQQALGDWRNSNAKHKCIPNDSKNIAIIGLGLLGQVTFRILNALNYNCIVYDIDTKKVQLAIDNGQLESKLRYIRIYFE